MIMHPSFLPRKKSVAELNCIPSIHLNKTTLITMDDLAGAINEGIASLPHHLAPANSNLPPPPAMDNDYHDFNSRINQHPSAAFDASGNSALFNDILANLAEEDKAASSSGARMSSLGAYPPSSGNMHHLNSGDQDTHSQTYISSTYQSRSRNNDNQGPVPPPPAAGMLYMPVPRPTGAAEGNPGDQGGESLNAAARTRPNRSDSLDSSGGSEYDESKGKGEGARGEEKHECKWQNCKQ